MKKGTTYNYNRVTGLYTVTDVQGQEVQITDDTMEKIVKFTLYPICDQLGISRERQIMGAYTLSSFIAGGIARLQGELKVAQKQRLEALERAERLSQLHLYYNVSGESKTPWDETK